MTAETSCCLEKVHVNEMLEDLRWIAKQIKTKELIYSEADSNTKNIAPYSYSVPIYRNINSNQSIIIFLHYIILLVFNKVFVMILQIDKMYIQNILSFIAYLHLQHLTYHQNKDSSSEKLAYEVYIKVMIENLKFLPFNTLDHCDTPASFITSWWVI